VEKKTNGEEPFKVGVGARVSVEEAYA